MEARRLTSFIALIVAIAAIGALTWYEYRDVSGRPAVFEPAVSTDESAPAAETPIEPLAKAEPEAAATPETPPPPADDAAAKETPPEPAPGGSMASSASAEAPAELAPGGSMMSEAPATAPEVPAATPETETSVAAVPEPAVEAPALDRQTPAIEEGEEAAVGPSSSEPEAAAKTEPPSPEAKPAPETEIAKTEPPAAEKPEVATETPETDIAKAEPPAAEPPALAAVPEGSETEVAKTKPPAPPEQPAAALPVVVPSFDVVRVEPTGDTVVAGLAGPNATVEILDGPTSIATAEANERGEWAIALDQPLPPGTHDLAVRTTSEDKSVVTLSDQRVAVSVPESGSKDVLVVLNTPDAASRVMQMPEEPAAKEPAPAETEIAANPPAAASEPGVVEGKAPAIASTDAGGSAPSTEPATGTKAPEIAAREPAIEVEPPIASEPPIKTEPPIAAKPPVSKEPPTVAEAPPAEPAIKPEVSIAAVEADTAGGFYIAGTATTPKPVRVYLDDKLVGETKPAESGTWLIETNRELQPGNYRVRADQVDDAGEVIVRAEVPFEREIEVAALKPTGSAGAATGTKLSGVMPEMETVIIKRGDNLWRLSRTMYGKGVRWSTLYEANRDQIRNPRWIFPGQVFLVPKGDTSWTD